MLSYNEVIAKISAQKFYIYGAGGYGKKVEKAIQKMGLQDNFLGYAVTEKRDNDHSEVLEIATVNPENLIIIATHYVNSKEMEAVLLGLNFHNYICIYPYLTELSLGLPYEKSVEFSTEKLVREYTHINFCAVLYLAIESILNNTELGKKLYIKMTMIKSNERTAFLRWQNLVQRVNLYRHGNIEEYPIQVSTDYKIVLDGAHRLMLAYYFGRPKILADLYHVDAEDYAKFDNGDVYKNDFFCTLLDEKEIEQLESTKRRIMGD